MRPRTAEQAAELQAAIEDVKARYALSDVIGRRTRLRRTGRELVGLCVFHSERTASLRVNDATGLYFCFGCGAGGDVIRFVRETEGLGFTDALRSLGVAGLPPVDPGSRARAAAEDAAERAAAVSEPRRVWEGAQPAAGTPAETYARSRGIMAALPPRSASPAPTPGAIGRRGRRDRTCRRWSGR